MIDIPPLRTPRINVRLRELTIAQAVKLAAIDPSRNEYAIGRFLAAAVDASEGAVADPGQWTVEERLMVLVHYLACTSDGDRNFDVGNGTHVVDYLLTDRETAPGVVALPGAPAGMTWTAGQVTGIEAELFEPLCASRFDWQIADMAARLRSSDDIDVPNAATHPAEYADWIRLRMEVLRNFPASDFDALFEAYLAAREPLTHLLTLGVDAEGYVAVAHADAGSEGGSDAVSLARFSVLPGAIGRAAGCLC